MTRKHSGFTLVEIAIVLVIIGLLLGGILKGQELINSAKVKNLAQDFRGIPLYIYGYQDKFKSVPGDDATASTHVAGAVNATTGGTLGNGIIEGNWDSTTKTDESFLFWQHVRLAGLAAGPTDLGTVTDATSALAFLPKNAEGGQVGVESGSAHYIKDATGTGFMPGTYVVCSKAILGKFAKQLDTQMDDGNAQTGSMRVVAMGHVRGNAAIATASIDDATPYTVCMGL